MIQALEEEFERVSGVAIATDGRDRALLVVVDLKRRSLPSQHSRIDELQELCRTAGVRVRGVVEQRRPEADPKTMIGRGKLEEVLIRAMQVDANVLIFDPDLTPGQAHAIADFTDLRVIDRTMLILDIFAQRAKSRDGKLQVELAQLRYRLPRLHEKNTMMSRLTGGIGGRGPGETKLEENRRRARERINRLEREIEHYGHQRAGRRSKRGARGLPVVAIVGYTNAGKSTLLNTLTNSEVLAEDKLFATLDPTTRRLRFPREREIIIADTVGFIRDLPQDLAQAFRATLEELAEADLLLHLVDAADPDHENQIAAVEKILTDLGLAETPRIMVMNKLDLLPPPTASDAPAGDEVVQVVPESGAGADAVSLVPAPIPAGRVAVNPIGGLPTFGISALDRQTTRTLLDGIEVALWKEGRLDRSTWASPAAEVGPPAAKETEIALESDRAAG
jgi:GTP-binding protein HflX